MLGLQSRLTVGAIDDQYEREADRVARQAVAMPPDAVAVASIQHVSKVEGEAGQTQVLQSKPMPLTASITPFLRRQASGEEAIEEKKDQDEGKDELLQGKFFNEPILSLPGQRVGTNKKSEPVEAELPTQRGVSPAAEDKDRVLQAMRAVSGPPAVQRQIQSDEELDDRQFAIQANFLTESCSSPMRRQSPTREEEPETPRAKPGGSLAGSVDAGEEIAAQLSQSRGQGSPLPDSVRAYMEPRFGVDFSHVRVHTGSNAIQMNRDIGAHAFTHGLDIFFGAGNSPANLELIAHELTHVVQQTGASPLRRREEKASLASPPPSSPHSSSPSSLPADTSESSLDFPIPEIANGSNTGISATAGIGMASPSPWMETGYFIQDSRTGAVRAAETQQALSTPASSASTGTREPGEFSEPPVSGTVPSAAPDITNNQASASGSEHKAPEAIPNPAPLASPMGGSAEKPAEAEPSGMGQITAAPDSAVKPHAVAQARLINSERLQSETQVARNAVTRRQQISEHFSGVRQGRASFLTKSIAGVRTLVVAKQSEIVTASARTRRDPDEYHERIAVSRGAKQ